MSSSDTAALLVEQLNLSAHPEGGWFRETWRGPDRGDGRAGGTAILFLLKAGERSHWHTVDAEEMWVWQGGDPLTLRVAMRDDGPVEATLLGPDTASGEALQGFVPTLAWQAAEALAEGEGAHGYSLVTCVVVPGFDFAGFTLAEPDWEPGSGHAGPTP
ncbi:MAG: cupin domain-containing protein [Erythrobacter sp.]|uniref:cupin domain-containing protein n=1 Tax=Erythrobacter sp. TaxID=1042 RepID=UPI00261F337A|nr:cupin domain-containing protein [Erythrobacter sp.]MDJ0979776.1 cupin domain-containing protein [Erythrobacter sp.]